MRIQNSSFAGWGAHPDTAAMENLVFTPVGSKRLVIKGITCLAALAGFALAAVSRCAPGWVGLL